jgi:protein involved in polysaccharide export with SLBB domain
MIIAILVTVLLVPLHGQTFGRIQDSETKTIMNEKQSMEISQSRFALEESIDPDTYILGPGDVVGLNILMSENVTLDLQVTPTGELFIPSVGVVQVDGLSISEAIVRVETFIHKQAYPGSKVDLALLNLRTFKIQVNGAVNLPGFIEITPLDRLTEVIALCEGFHQLAQEFKVEIYRKNGKKEIVNYLTFMRDGTLTQNPTFLEGDRIYVPFGSMEKEGVVLRGAVKGGGYDLIEPGEVLGEFLQRRVNFNQNADLESVTVTRALAGKTEYLRIEPKDFFSTALHAGETIDILRERGIMVNGFVLTPGGFEFFPGYTAADYISMAGGNSSKGNPDRCSVRHRDGTIEYGQGTLIRRGDVIVVPRTWKDTFIGETSALQIIVSLTTIYLAFIATGA